ncbi:MAG TPA: acyl-CoA dehydratase activase-related protein [Syntrophomonadaceae bacterium]|nr:acyl-CoA dehydratase activase-related protein [Syntrophomonadaceae bacterium]
MKRIGIPQGLFYYYYFPLWKTFFMDLGLEVITSSNTTRQTMDRGIAVAVDETCLPIKVYLGHIVEIIQHHPDYLFVPRLVSVEQRSYICPKFMGLPDMVRALVPDCPPLIDITIDLSRNERVFNRDLMRLGQFLGCSKRAVQRALHHAEQELRFCQTLASQGGTMAEAIQVWEGQGVATQEEGDLHIGVLGHGYAIYDAGLSMNLVNQFRQQGCRVLLAEGIESQVIEERAASIPKRVFWTLGRRLLGSALHMDQRSDIDGIVYTACFGCGPDSIIGEIIQRYIKHKPFMFLTMDEHTGEAGLLTRLEAFCDMLRRRRNKDHEDNISPYGQPAYSLEDPVFRLETGGSCSTAHH